MPARGYLTQDPHWLASFSQLPFCCSSAALQLLTLPGPIDRNFLIGPRIVGELAVTGRDGCCSHRNAACLLRHVR